MMSSTLVETVSINYEDFNDSFLTCGTCLCIYDGLEHAPKLLPCSHTVCRSCLERIAEAQVHDTGTFRCPICRETITFPRGGVTSFPPSFLVNQLLDLMSRQRREVIPKCSHHTSEELLFCETCDRVFCTQCTGGEHNGRGASEHTVIPFSIAIKRMSEILLYKAHLCIKNLNNAYDTVSLELSRLETTVERAIEMINRSFQDVISVVEKRRHECLQLVRKIRQEKQTALREQLEMIQAEKEKVQGECDGLQYQVEVRNITRKIGDLNEKLDATGNLAEPRENSFLCYEYKHNSAHRDILNAVSRFGGVKVSTTFPALSTAKIDKAITHLQSIITVHTVDYHGNNRTTGGDPVTTRLQAENGDYIDSKVTDNEDGTYTITYVPTRSGTLTMSIKIFQRPIKDSPFLINISDHNNPVWKIGSHGSGEINFLLPVRVALARNGSLCVLDTGNNRIKLISGSGQVTTHLSPGGLESQSCTGMALTPDDEIAVVNWRTKYISVIDMDGNLLKQFTSDSLVEPIDIAVNSKGEFVVADNGASKVFIFDPSGKLLKTFGTKGDKEGQFKLVSAVTIGKCDEILVADHRIQVFGKDCKFSRQVPVSVKGQYGGICVDSTGHILASRTEKGKSFIQVYNSCGKLLFNIDSFDDKLKRPSGLAVTADHHVYVVDLGNECLKKFRYK